MSKVMGLVLTAVTVGLSSCNRNLYDEGEYIRYIEEEQTVDTIDRNHTWELMETYSMVVDATTVSSGTRRVQVLNGNPLSASGVTVLADQPFRDGQKSYVSFTAPLTAKQFYAALIDGDGRYTLAQFDLSTRQADFATPLATQAEVNTRQMGRQTYTYCFEEEMPEPGDYDYNDVVLRMSQRQTADNQVTVDVTLAAVGSLNQIAAAINLVNYSYDEIESVVTEEDETFNEGIDKTSSYRIIGSDDLLMKGRANQAVLNLFEDAHWATGSYRVGNNGVFDRDYLNVTSGTSINSNIVSPRTISYVITFKNASLLNYFTLEDLDPFIIIGYAGIFWEVHSHYSHRADMVFYQYSVTQRANVLPWGLIVPTGSFRYPLEGTNIGYYKNGALFGAYMTDGHSFGEWAMNRNWSHDWYNYALSTMVF